MTHSVVRGPLAVFNQWYEAHESRDVAALSAVLDDAVEVRSLFRSDPARGRDAAVAHFVGVTATFSDLAMGLTCAPAVAEDRVLVEVLFTGRFTGELTWQGRVHHGLGQPFKVPGVAVVRSAHGRVQCVQTLFDRADWLLQVGVDATVEAGARQ